MTRCKSDCQGWNSNVNHLTLFVLNRYSLGKSVLKLKMRFWSHKFCSSWSVFAKVLHVMQSVFSKFCFASFYILSLVAMQSRSFVLLSSYFWYSFWYFSTARSWRLFSSSASQIPRQITSYDECGRIDNRSFYHFCILRLGKVGNEVAPCWFCRDSAWVRGCRGHIWMCEIKHCKTTRFILACRKSGLAGSVPQPRFILVQLTV